MTQSPLLGVAAVYVNRQTDKMTNGSLQFTKFHEEMMLIEIPAFRYL